MFFPEADRLPPPPTALPSVIAAADVCLAPAAATPSACAQMLKRRGAMAAASAGGRPASARGAANGRVERTASRLTRRPFRLSRTLRSPSIVTIARQKASAQEVALG